MTQGQGSIQAGTGCSKKPESHRQRQGIEAWAIPGLSIITFPGRSRRTAKPRLGFRRDGYQGFIVAPQSFRNAPGSFFPTRERIIKPGNELVPDAVPEKTRITIGGIKRIRETPGIKKSEDFLLPYAGKWSDNGPGYRGYALQSDSAATAEEAHEQLFKAVIGAMAEVESLAAVFPHQPGKGPVAKGPRCGFNARALPLGMGFNQVRSEHDEAEG
jgi:hypothetical protein